MKKKSTPARLARMFGISQGRAMESIIKAELISAVLNAATTQGLTHAEIAKRSEIPRGAVTGILSGSLQKVTIDRVLRLVEAVGLTVEVRTHRKIA